MHSASHDRLKGLILQIMDFRREKLGKTFGRSILSMARHNMYLFTVQASVPCPQ